MTFAEQREVNYELIDAQVRVELSSKKYRHRHEVYLQAVTAGTKADKPKVYDSATNKPKPSPAKKAAKKTAAKKKAAKKR